MDNLTSGDRQAQTFRRIEDKSDQTLVAYVVMLALAYVAVGIRFWSRRLSQATIKADDWTIGAGLVSTVNHRV